MIAGTVTVVLVNLFGISNYYSEFRKEAWDRAAAHVAERVEPDDLLLFHANFIQLPFDYYFRKYQKSVAERGVPVDAPFRSGARSEVRATDLPELKALINRHERIWIISSYNASTDPLNLIPTTLRHLARLVSREGFYGIEVELYKSNLS